MSTAVLPYMSRRATCRTSAAQPSFDALSGHTGHAICLAERHVLRTPRALVMHTMKISAKRGGDNVKEMGTVDVHQRWR